MHTAYECAKCQACTVLTDDTSRYYLAGILATSSFFLVFGSFSQLRCCDVHVDVHVLLNYYLFFLVEDFLSVLEV